MMREVDDQWTSDVEEAAVNEVCNLFFRFNLKSNSNILYFQVTIMVVRHRAAVDISMSRHVAPRIVRPRNRSTANAADQNESLGIADQMNRRLVVAMIELMYIITIGIPDAIGITMSALAAIIGSRVPDELTIRWTKEDVMETRTPTGLQRTRDLGQMDGVWIGDTVRSVEVVVDRTTGIVVIQEIVRIIGITMSVGLRIGMDQRNSDLGNSIVVDMVARRVITMLSQWSMVLDLGIVVD